MLTVTESGSLSGETNVLELLAARLMGNLMSASATLKATPS
jgi:hypothetical protein